MFIFIALSSYFLSALAVILDKFLLGSKRISSAPVYSFYIGILGLAVLFFLPFGFYIPSAYQMLISVLSGAFFSLGILFLYFAIQKGEASRVLPIIGALIPTLTYFFSFLFSSEKFALLQVAGIVLLIFGGLLISFDLPLKINKRKFFAGFKDSVIAGTLLAVAYFIFKFVYSEQTFLNGFMWTRIGCFLAILSYLIVPSWRKDILKSLRGFRNPRRENYRTGVIFASNKIIGGMSSILFNLAISLGSVAVANSLVSAQYVFILFLAYAAHKKYPFIFKEKPHLWDWAQKAGAILLIGLGVVMIY